MRIIREGYKIQFTPYPQFPPSIISRPYDPSKQLALANEIKSYLISGAISKVSHNDNQILSRVFIVKKANGKNRMIIDLSKINTQINKVSFKMETIEDILDVIEPGDFMASIDLCDAFFSVPIHFSCRDYLTFEFNDQRYSFNVLPFGLTSSPRIFSKVLRPAIIHLRAQGVKIFSYLDDIFLCAKDKDLLSLHVSSSLSLLSSLGYFPNYEKSHLMPSLELSHLGFVINTNSMTISIPEPKLSKIREMATSLLSKPVTLRSLTSFIGLVVSIRLAFPLAPIYFRALQSVQSHYLKSGLDWDSYVTLDYEATENLLWWKNSNYFPPSPIKTFEPDLILSSDSSKTGWGGILSTGETVSGSWSQDESYNHINILELKAVHFCILSFSSILANKSIYIYSDNITTVFYINKVGGTHSKELCKIAIEIWNSLSTYNIKCKAFHIPGVQNSLADDCSRRINDPNDFALSVSAFSFIISIISFNPSIDLFASRLSAKIPRYVSRFRDPFSFKIDAFSFTWPNKVYMFPPISQIPKVISKIQSDEVKEALLITPAWPGLTSLPTILSLMVDSPIFIPAAHLEGPSPTRHPFHMMGWIISSQQQKQRAYLQTLQHVSLTASPNQLYPPTKDTGNSLLLILTKLGHKMVFVPI